MDFSATRISTQDFTSEQIKSILADAKQQIEAEPQQSIRRKIPLRLVEKFPSSDDLPSLE